MRRFLIEYRFVISLALAAIAGAAGLRAWPFPAGNPLLGLIEVNQPAIYAGFSVRVRDRVVQHAFLPYQDRVLVRVHLCGAARSPGEAGGAVLRAHAGQGRSAEGD